MVISVSNTITHKACCEKSLGNPIELEHTVLQQLKKMGLSSNDVKRNKEGHLVLAKPEDLKLHTLLLQLEALGLDIKLTKQTLIEIC